MDDDEWHLHQSSYEEWGEAVQPGSNGSSEPQQCQYWKTLPESGVFIVPPSYTLSNFLLVSPVRKIERDMNQGQLKSKIRIVTQMNNIILKFEMHKFSSM